MNTQLTSVLLLASLLFAGCDSRRIELQTNGGVTDEDFTSDKHTAEQDVDTTSIDGFKIVYSKNVKPAGVFSIGKSHLLRMSFPDFTLYTVKGELLKDREHFGQVSKGDTIRIRDDGRISVNGQLVESNGDSIFENGKIQDGIDKIDSLAGEFKPTNG